MVRTFLLGRVKAGLERAEHLLIDYYVIQPPSNIPFTDALYGAPPSVMAWRIAEDAKRIAEAIFQ